MQKFCFLGKINYIYIYNSVIVDWPSSSASAGTVAVAASWPLGAVVVVVAGTPVAGFAALQEF